MNNSRLSSKEEFQRGWRILLACFCGIGGGISSISFYTSGIFIVPIEEEFGWSRTSITVQGIITVLALVIGSPFIGRLIDRVGVERWPFFL